MTPLLQRLYKMRRKKRIKDEKVIEQRRNDEAVAIRQAQEYRRARIWSRSDWLRYREDF